MFQHWYIGFRVPVGFGMPTLIQTLQRSHPILMTSGSTSCRITLKMCNPELKDDTKILKEISGSVSSRDSSKCSIHYNCHIYSREVMATTEKNQSNMEKMRENLTTDSNPHKARSILSSVVINLKIPTTLKEFWFSTSCQRSEQYYESIPYLHHAMATFK